MLQAPSTRSVRVTPEQPSTGPLPMREHAILAQIISVTMAQPHVRPLALIPPAVQDRGKSTTASNKKKKIDESFFQH